MPKWHDYSFLECQLLILELRYMFQKLISLWGSVSWCAWECDFAFKWDTEVLGLASLTLSREPVSIPSVSRLWSGSMTAGSSTFPHTPPQVRVSSTPRSCWRSTRTSRSRQRWACIGSVPACLLRVSRKTSNRILCVKEIFPKNFIEEIPYAVGGTGWARWTVRPYFSGNSKAFHTVLICPFVSLFPFCASDFWKCLPPPSFIFSFFFVLFVLLLFSFGFPSIFWVLAIFMERWCSQLDLDGSCACFLSLSWTVKTAAVASCPVVQSRSCPGFIVGRVYVSGCS